MTIAVLNTDFTAKNRFRRDLKNEYIVFAYQDLANMGYYAAGVLNTLNKYLTDPLEKSEIKLFTKTSPISFPKIEMIGAGFDTVIGPDVSQRAFKKLIRLNSAAMRSLKLRCWSNPDCAYLEDDEVAKLKEKWVGVTKQILVCLYELRETSNAISTPAPDVDDIPHNPLEERLIAARSGMAY